MLTSNAHLPQLFQGIGASPIFPETAALNDAPSNEMDENQQVY